MKIPNEPYQTGSRPTPKSALQTADNHHHKHFTWRCAVQENPFVHDFVQFMKHEKKWWLTPLAALALISLLLILFAGGSEATPFLYPTN